MPLTPSFKESQILGEPGGIVLKDTSTGLDAAVTARRVYLRLANGTYLRPAGVTTDYVLWPLADTTLSLDVLTADKAVDVTVLWVDTNGLTLYTKTTLCLFTQFTKSFLYNLTQGQTGNPGLVNDNGYWEKKSELFTEVDSALNAVELAADIHGAQACLVRAQKIIANAFTYFF
jgi:hypothetical protein